MIANHDPGVQTRAVLEKERLVLRPPRASDKADRLRYGRDPEVRRMVGGDPLL